MFNAHFPLPPVRNVGLMNHAKYFIPSPIVDKEALF